MNKKNKQETDLKLQVNQIRRRVVTVSDTHSFLGVSMFTVILINSFIIRK